MRTPVFVASSFVAQYPEGGGNFWVPLQWVLGLRDAGCDAVWYEVLWTRGDAARDRACIASFLDHVRALGVADRTLLLHYAEGTREAIVGAPAVHGDAALLERRHDALLVNLANSLPTPLRAPFARTALLDIDPGTFQLWAREHDMGVGGHDVHCTIGMHLGADDCPIPLDGVAWTRLWPCVHLPSWPAQPPPARDAAYTTVTQWWNGQWAVLDGEIYDCNKRAGFLPILPLAGRTKARLELAANLHAEEREDRALIAAAGWRLVEPAEVAGSPEAFRRYVQASRGEVSAAKPAYVKARAGWVSDRTICYLASGRPCLVEATGAEVHVPLSAGLRFFASLDEAADGLRAIEGDWPRASQAARRLAEDVFAADVVVPQLLRACGA
jgi:hypothetical protein